jgi:hypothetical protein
MAAAQHEDGEQHRIIVAKEKVAACQGKLERYRKALEAGTDPKLVQEWITQVQAEKAVAEAELRRAGGKRTMTADEIGTIVEALSGIAAILKAAEPADKAEVYRQLGLRPKYEPGLRLIKAEAAPDGSCSKLCPRGDSNTRTTHLCDTQVFKCRMCLTLVNLRRRRQIQSRHPMRWRCSTNGEPRQSLCCCCLPALFRL